ncbi:nocobactin polyketide synthase NbtC [Nocardia brasiliensis]|uniref:nocobactin polyketide synthase NbtC n=1 Tax=Nocardia brasiliensis TaxID=37326 RepID=UPI0024557C0B|nr:nocobactin polyketide synthase NbtC [Nocardia brasiliensis]
MSSHRLPDGSIPVLLSSDAPDSLRREAAAILSYLQAHAAVGPDQVADMLFRTRVARRYRALAMVTERAELVEALRAVAAGEPHAAVIATGSAAKARKIGYIFPGQGSQYAGMGRMFYENSPAYRAAVDEAEAVFQDLFELSPRSYLLAESEPGHNLLRIVQPALFMQMVGLAAMWRAAGVVPAVTVGHSQGELAAGVVSGVITLADAVRVVTLRGGLVDTIAKQEDREDKYSMAVVGVDREECEAILARHSGWAELSVINSPHVLAIGGERRTVAQVVADLTAEGKFAKEIRVGYPAHTSVVTEFRDSFLDNSLAAKLDRPEFTATEIECIGSTLGTAITPDLPVGDYWYWNLRNRVRFDLAIALAAERGVDTYLEIADHPALFLAVQENLSAVAQQRDFQTIGTSRRTATDLREFTRNLGLVAVSDLGYDWSALRTDSAGAPRLPLLDFPNTQMNPKHLWAAYDHTAVRTAVPNAVATAPISAASEQRTVPAQRIVEQWVRLRSRALVPPRTMAVLDHGGRSAELVAALGDAAALHGVTIVDPAAATHSAGTAFDTAVVVLPELDDLATGAAVTELAEFLGDRTWLPRLDGVRDVWLVTVGGEQVLEADVPNLFHAAAQAGFRCLAADHLGVSFRHVDLAPGRPLPDTAKALMVALHTAREPELALRDGGVYAKRLVAEDVSAVSPLGADDLREVVIVGGTGKLGLDFCERFARDGAGRITLLSRSGGAAEALARIEQIRQLGATEVVVRRCDVTDEASVRALADEYGSTPADLIVHAAVDYVAAAELTPASVREAAAPKVVALEHLVQHFPRTSNGRVVLCSSLSATIGGRGHMAYAAVNRMLDAAAARYRSQGIASTAVQWGLWRAVGADQADALAAISGTGLRPMEPASAIAAGITARAENVIIATADWDRLATLFSAFGFDPLFSTLDLGDLPAEQAELPADPVPAPAPVTPEPPAAAVQVAAPNTAEQVRFALRAVMGMDTTETIDGSVPLVALGLDSLQALDLRKRIEVELQRELPVTAILGGASLDEVVTLLG